MSKPPTIQSSQVGSLIRTESNLEEVHDVELCVFAVVYYAFSICRETAPEVLETELPQLPTYPQAADRGVEAGVCVVEPVDDVSDVRFVGAIFGCQG
jgi:hypothetical protein